MPEALVFASFWPGIATSFSFGEPCPNVKILKVIQVRILYPFLCDDCFMAPIDHFTTNHHTPYSAPSPYIIMACSGLNFRFRKLQQSFPRGGGVRIWSMACSVDACTKWACGSTYTPKDWNRTPNAPAWTKTCILMLRDHLLFVFCSRLWEWMHWPGRDYHCIVCMLWHLVRFSPSMQHNKKKTRGSVWA